MTPTSPSLNDPRALLRHLFDAAVQRALPRHNTAACLPPPPRGRTVVIGAGKAGGAMAQVVEALWPADAPLSGLVVTRYGHTPPRPAGLPERIEVVEASHPVPDAAGLAAAEREVVTGAGPRKHPRPEVAAEAAFGNECHDGISTSHQNHGRGSP